MIQKLELTPTARLTTALSIDPIKCQTETITLSPWYLQLGWATMTRPALGTKVLESEEPTPVLTQLPFAGTHGLHHPDGQGRLQHGNPHVCKADGPFKGARGLVCFYWGSRVSTPYCFQIQVNPTCPEPKQSVWKPKTSPAFIRKT